MPMKNDDAFVINTDKSTGPGTHWVCCIKKQGVILYFDSYGLPPLQNLIDNKTCKIQYSTSKIQPDNSIICGHLCVDFIKKIRNGQKMYDIIHSFEQL